MNSLNRLYKKICNYIIAGFYIGSITGLVIFIILSMAGAVALPIALIWAIVKLVNHYAS